MNSPVNFLGAAWLCLAWILGIVSARIGADGAVFWWVPALEFDLGLGLGRGLGLGSAIAAWILPRYWWRGPTRRLWLAMACVAIVASGYSHWRLPSPSPQDISQFVVQVSKVCPTPHLEGKVVTEPR